MYLHNRLYARMVLILLLSFTFSCVGETHTDITDQQIKDATILHKNDSLDGPIARQEEDNIPSVEEIFYSPFMQARDKNRLKPMPLSIGDIMGSFKNAQITSDMYQFITGDIHAGRLPASEVSIKSKTKYLKTEY